MERNTIETIVYGGAFNPPTLAHQAIVQACIEYAEPRNAEVWLLPSGNRADKTIDTSYERRLRLLDALVKDVVSRGVQLKINSTELDREEPTQTYETIEEFEDAYPDRAFRWVFGTDSVASMPLWEKGEWMKENVLMLVVDRPGAPLVEIGKNAEWLPAETPTISSTEVRRRMQNGENYRELVGENVYTELCR